MRTGAVVAIQDMGAAGLTSSTFEMAGRGGTGLHLDLDKVPLRQPGLTPYEMMLSESQERMVLVAKKGREEEVEQVFRRWGLEVAVIGEITDDRPRRPHLARRDRGGHPDPAADRGGARLPPTGRASRRTWQSAGRHPRSRSPTTSGGSLERLLATPELAQQGLDLAAVRPHRAHQHRRRARAATPRCCCLKGTAAGLAMTLRRQSGLLPLRPPAGRRPGRGRGGAQHRLRRAPSPWASPTA